jgi:hypothetical protein
MGVTGTSVIEELYSIQSLFDRKMKSVKGSIQRSKLGMNYNKPQAELGRADAKAGWTGLKRE